MKPLQLAAMLSIGASLCGCAANLKAVRDFAGETKHITVAFDPMLDGTVEQCRQRVVFKGIYTSDMPLAKFAPTELSKQAQATCQPIADKNADAKKMGVVLAEYADRLTTLAGDDVSASLDDDADALAAKIGSLDVVPADKLDAVNRLIKYVTRAVIAQQQKRAIAETLDHEEAVGALGDGMVVYARRAYGGNVNDRRRDIQVVGDSFRAAEIAAQPWLARSQLMDLQRQDQQLADQQAAIDAFARSVAQMKVAMHDLRINLDKLSDKERRQEILKLAKEVRSLFQQIQKTF